MQQKPEGNSNKKPKEITSHDIKEVLGVIKKQIQKEERASMDTNMEAIQSLEVDDLAIYAGDHGYMEYVIEDINKDNEKKESFVVNTYKPGDTDTGEESISAKQLYTHLTNRNLKISKSSENLDQTEENELRVRVVTNAIRQIETKLENQEHYKINPEKADQLKSTLDYLISLQKDFTQKIERVSAQKESAIIKTEEFSGEEALKKITEIFSDKNFVFPPIATHGAEFRGKKGKELREKYPEEFQLTPDVDAQIALELLQESMGMTEKNLASEKGQEYFDRQLKKENIPSQVIIVPKGQYAEGAINIDTGGKQGIVLEQKTTAGGNTTNTIWIDHHGTKKEILTSATALMLQFVKKIPQLQFKHEAQEKQWSNISNFVTDIDNISFNTNPTFIRTDYARTLYGLHQEIPTNQLIKELKNKNEKKIYNEEELTEKGWLDASKRQQFKVDISLGKKPGEGGVLDLVKQMQEKRVATETPALGKYVLENYREYDRVKNKPKNPLGFLGVKASGMDSHITLQPGGGFFMSSLKDLTPTYEKLVTAFPEIKDQAVLVRGTMIAYDPRRIEGAKAITERELIIALDLTKKFEHKKQEKRPFVKKHIPGQRKEDAPIPVHVQEFIKASKIDVKELRFHTLNNKPASEHFDPQVKLFSEQQRKFIDIVKEVAEKMNLKPENNETLDHFIERISKAA